MTLHLEHIAVASNSEKNSDKFFISLLGMKKTREFDISSELMNKIFGISKETHAIRYESYHLNVEVFIINDNSKAKDIYTHNCLLVKDPDKFVSQADSMEFPIKKIPRKKTGYYYFTNDLFGNLYEIKQI